jgi:hypothetical protein
MGERRKIITPSLCFEADDDYILDEDVYSTLTISLLQTDTEGGQRVVFSFLPPLSSFFPPLFTFLPPEK